MRELEEALRKSPEVSIMVASRWLGVTERTLLSYLKSKQIQAVKVGEDWFIKSESVITIRPLGTSLQDVVLPELENPLSQKQQESRNRKKSGNSTWQLKKTARRSPERLNCFVRLQDAWDLFNIIKPELPTNSIDLFEKEMLLIGDELSAGYYSFGGVKRKLYARARLRAGRLISRCLLLEGPQGFYMSLCHVVEAISFLCRKMDIKESGNAQSKVEAQRA